MLNKVGGEGMCLNIIKTIYDKPTVSFILNGKKFRAFPLRSGIRQRCPLSPFLFNTLLEVSSTTVKHEKETKNIQIGREDIKLFLFSDDMILNIENPRVHQKINK